MFKTWPNDEFTNLTLEQRQAFYVAVKGMGASATRSHVETLISTDTHTERTYKEGKFMPLSVWRSDEC